MRRLSSAIFAYLCVEIGSKPGSVTSAGFSIVTVAESVDIKAFARRWL